MKPSELYVKLESKEWGDKMVPVKVKALEWEDRDYGSLACGDPMRFDYIVESHGGAWFALHQHMDEGVFIAKSGTTRADAKAACQAHYESMIYELLEVR